jgi:phosphoesterase RecJ-like protein
VVTPTDYPDYYKWMAGNEQVVIYTANRAACRQLAAAVDLIFCLDFNSYSRLQEFGKSVEQSAALKVMIDHHPEPEMSCDFVWWRTSASSTAELVFELISHLQCEHLVSSDAANCLYAGVLTDTGSFQHSIHDPSVFAMVAGLMRKGADARLVYDRIYNSYSAERLKFFGFAITERLQLFPEHRAAVMSVPLEDQLRFNVQLGDTEGLVNYPLKVKGIIFSALVIDRKELRKISLRSKGNFDVNQFVREHFGGGGHRNAAGANTQLSLAEASQKIIELLPQYSLDLNQQP